MVTTVSVLQLAVPSMCGCTIDSGPSGPRFPRSSMYLSHHESNSRSFGSPAPTNRTYQTRGGQRHVKMGTSSVVID